MSAFKVQSDTNAYSFMFPSFFEIGEATLIIIKVGKIAVPPCQKNDGRTAGKRVHSQPENKFLRKITLHTKQLSTKGLFISIFKHTYCKRPVLVVVKNSCKIRSITMTTCRKSCHLIIRSNYKPRALEKTLHPKIKFHSMYIQVVHTQS